MIVTLACRVPRDASVTLASCVKWTKAIAYAYVAFHVTLACRSRHMCQQRCEGGVLIGKSAGSWYTPPFAHLHLSLVSTILSLKEARPWIQELCKCGKKWWQNNKKNNVEVNEDFIYHIWKQLYRHWNDHNNALVAQCIHEQGTDDEVWTIICGIKVEL